MATKKRRRSTKRRRVHHTRARAHNPINPTHRRRRRRRSTVHARRRAGMTRAVARRRNPYRRRRSRNPLTSGASGEILNFTIAGLAQGLAQPFVSGFAGRFLPFGQYNPPILAFGTGWLLSKVFGMFGFTRRFSHAAYVFGAATAAMQLLQPIVARTLGGGAANPTMSGPYRRAGMRGIGAWPGIPNGVPLMPPAPPANGMQGLGMWPGVPQGVPMR